MDTKFTAELDKFLASLARLFVHKGASAEVAVLTLGRPTCQHLDLDYGYYHRDNIYKITLEVPPSLFNQVADRRETVEKSLCDASAQLMGRYPGVELFFIIMSEMPDDPDWRNKARRWLSGEGLSNQGRVRSDNVAPYQVDGLLFRSHRRFTFTAP